MSISSYLFRSLMLERPARSKSLAELTEDLVVTGREITTTIAGAPDTPENRQALSHVIGIERWGQRRLRVALGEPLLVEEYDGYRPGQEESLAQLQAAFQATRQETLSIARQLQEQQVPVDLTIPHNSLNELTVRGWLRYLTIHASWESKRVKN
ncbi:MAG: DinB family protein [Anaerolineales bacterium]|nr:DinB family protein [Anaerolineales bacterium]